MLGSQQKSQLFKLFCFFFCDEVNGEWSAWSTWAACSVSCGGGPPVQRTRYCNNPAPQHGGIDCAGNSVATYHTQCNTIVCPGKSNTFISKTNPMLYEQEA